MVHKNTHILNKLDLSKIGKSYLNYFFIITIFLKFTINFLILTIFSSSKIVNIMKIIKSKTDLGIFKFASHMLWASI